MISPYMDSTKRILYEIIKENPGISAIELFRKYSELYLSKERIIESRDNRVLRELLNEG